MSKNFEQGFMDKLAEISSPEDLDALYSKLKYRVLNKDTNRPYFNTNRETFDNWHLLSPEQIRKHKIGICWDTAAMTDKVLGDLGVEHANYFSHSKDLSKPTHSFNVYKDENGDWRWLEGSWGDYKGNDWKERRKRKLVRRIIKALETAGGDKQILHSVDKFPEPGVSGSEFYEAMLKQPVKQAESEEERRKRAIEFVEAVRKMALKRKLNYFLVTDGASGISNNGNPAVRNAREAQIKWELEHGADPYEDWSKQAQAYDRKKWPDYEDYLKKHPDPKIELVERLVREHYAKQHPWGAKTESGQFLSHDQVKNRNIDDIVIRGGDNILRQRRGMCHELSNARLKMLRDHGIDARRLFAFYGVGQDTDGLLGHSFVMFKGDDGKYHFASPGMHDTPKKNFGSFDDLKDAVTQYIAAIKSRGDGSLTDDDYVEIHDTTDMDVPDKIKYKDFVRKALKNDPLYVQGKYAEYEPPWTIDRIRDEYGDIVADKLANDPVHKWRSDTGIELIHKEPTKEELERIIMNWKLMDYLQKRRSNKKSKELFGLTNLQHAKKLLSQYS